MPKQVFFYAGETETSASMLAEKGVTPVSYARLGGDRRRRARPG